MPSVRMRLAIEKLYGYHLAAQRSRQQYPGRQNQALDQTADRIQRSGEPIVRR